MIGIVGGDSYCQGEWICVICFNYTYLLSKCCKSMILIYYEIFLYFQSEGFLFARYAKFIYIMCQIYYCLTTHGI